MLRKNYLNFDVNPYIDVLAEACILPYYFLFLPCLPLSASDLVLL